MAAKKQGGNTETVGPEEAPDSTRDFASALDELPEEVESDGGELDAEQEALAAELGFTGSKAVAFKRFVETML